MALVGCGMCEVEVDQDAGDFCWVCHADLCGDCWEEHGHCSKCTSHARVTNLERRVSVLDQQVRRLLEAKRA